MRCSKLKNDSVLLGALLLAILVFSPPLKAYIPDVGPGICVSENCDDTYTPPSSSSSGSSYSSSGGSDYSSGGGGGYYNSYDAMAMNTAVGLMGSFMNSMMAGMEKAAAQQAEYQQQVAEQQRVEAELARQERDRLLVLKKAEQAQLRADYKSKMSVSSASIKAGISRIEGMLGQMFSPDESPLKIETLDAVNPNGLDWDGRQGGSSSSEAFSAPLALLQDDFVDSNIVDLRDKTDLTVRPEVVRGEPRYDAAAPAIAEPAVIASETNLDPTPAGAVEAPGESAELDGAPPDVRDKPAAIIADTAPEIQEPENKPTAAGGGDVKSEPQAPSEAVEIPEAVPSEEELTEHPAAVRQLEIPSGSQGYVEAPSEMAGAEPYAPSIPWRAVPVQNEEIDPAVLKGDTPPIRPETVETLKEERRMGRNFNQKSEDRVQELRAESQMEGIRAAAEKDLREKAEVWKRNQALGREMAARDKAELDANPELRQALEDARQEWQAAEKEYEDMRKNGKTMDEDLTYMLLDTDKPSQAWPGPKNPEPSLTEPVKSDDRHFAGVLKVWKKRRAVRMGPVFDPPSGQDTEEALGLLEQIYAENRKFKVRNP